MPPIPYCHSPNGAEGAAQLAWPTWVTTTTAFGAVSAKADVLLPWDGQRFTAGLASSASSGRLFHPIPRRSLTCVYPVGVGADNATGDLRIWRWIPIVSKLDQKQPNVVQMTPVLLYVATFALCAQVGLTPVAGSINPIIDNTVRYADGFSSTTDCSLAPLLVRTMGLPSTGTPNDGKACLVVDALEAALLEFEVRCGTATSVNLLIESPSISR